MTDQYKALRKAALHSRSEEWAKQALQLLDEMEAVGAGGISGKLVTNGGGIGWMKDLAKGGHGMPFVELIQGEEMMIDAGMSKLHEWVDLISSADDETKAVLRVGLKEEIDRMFSDSAERVEPVEDDGWIEWRGGECPVPHGVVVDVKHGHGKIFRNQRAGCRGFAHFWDKTGSCGDIVAYRVVK